MSYTSTPHPPFCIELDSHADTSAFNPDHCIIIQDTGDRVSVAPFKEGLGLTKQVPIVSLAVAFNSDLEHHTYVQFWHQVMAIPGLQQHLVCPSQLEENGVKCHLTNLCHLAPQERNFKSHSITTNYPSSPHPP